MKRNLITGMVILLPLVITIYVAKIIIHLLTKPFTGLIKHILTYHEMFSSSLWLFSSEQVLHYTSSFLALVTFCGLVIGIGYAASRAPMFAYFVWGIDFAFAQIPVVDKIYLGCKEIVDALLNGTEEKFGEVVLVPFPNETQMSIGFIMKRLPEQKGEKLLNFIPVFVPGAPNPTTGYILLYRPEQIIYPKMEVDEAVKSIVSCGTMLNDISVKVKG